LARVSPRRGVRYWKRELLFHDEHGAPLRRDRFGDAWRETVERAGLPNGTRYHHLRHHFASTLIASGCSVKAVQDTLGHASARETLDTYSHLWPTDHDRVRAAIETSLRRDSAEDADISRRGSPS
jgi:site-specific recombinase XerD